MATSKKPTVPRPTGNKATDEFARGIEDMLKEKERELPEPIPVPEVEPASDEDVDSFFGDLQ